MTAPAFPAPRTHPFDAPHRWADFRERGGLHKVTIWDGTEHWPPWCSPCSAGAVRPT